MTALSAYTFTDHFSFTHPGEPHFDDLLVGWTSTFKELCAADPRTIYDSPDDIPWEDYDKGLQYDTSGQFLRWYTEWLVRRFREIKDCVRTHVEDHQIPIWRGMAVPKDWTRHLEQEGLHLGIYWSCDPRYARPLRPPNDHTSTQTVLLHSRVDTKVVNWKDTFQQLMHPRRGWQEREIRLYRGTPLELLSARSQGEELTKQLTDCQFIA